MKKVLNSLILLSALLFQATIFGSNVDATSAPKEDSPSKEISRQPESETSTRSSVKDKVDLFSKITKQEVNYAYDYDQFMKSSRFERLQIFKSAMRNLKTYKLALRFVERLIADIENNTEFIQPILEIEEYQEAFDFVFKNRHIRSRGSAWLFLRSFSNKVNKYIAETRRYALAPVFADFALSLYERKTELNWVWINFFTSLFENLNHLFSGRQDDDESREVGIKVATYLMSKREIDSSVIANLLQDYKRLDRQFRLTIYRFICKDDISWKVTDDILKGRRTWKGTPLFMQKLLDSPLVPEDRASAIDQYFPASMRRKGPDYSLVSPHLQYIDDLTDIVNDYLDVGHRYGETNFNDLKLIQIWNQQDFEEFDSYYGYD